MRRTVRDLAVYAAGPAFVAASLAVVMTYAVAPADVEVRGAIAVGVLAGNEYDFNLNAYAADLQEALASEQVRSAADEVSEGAVRGLRAERQDEASRFSLRLVAADADDGERAMLAAGRTALTIMAVERERELLDEQALAAASLQARLAAGEQLAPAEAVDAERDDPLRDARRAAVDRALADLAEVQRELAIVREILTADPVPGVEVTAVVPHSQLARASRTAVSSAAAAALFGGLVLVARRRPGSRGPDRAVSPDDVAGRRELSPA